MSRTRADDFHVTGKPLSWDARDRAAALAQARTLDFDLVIIGGGITGAGIAREAALRGIRFLLLDQDDFAAGTSSRSSKLVHGGMRYLAQGEFGLVREAATERNWLRQALPNLVRPLAFHWCAWAGGQDSPGRIRLALALYDLLSDTFSRHRNAGRRRILSPAELAECEPALGRQGLLLAGRYYDCSVDDARLTLETLKEARDLSGGRSVALNHVRVERVLLEAGRARAVRCADLLAGEGFDVSCGCVVNATGVWTDATLERAGLPSRLIRPTKGVHLVVPNARLGNRAAFALRSLDDGRSFFVLPRGEVSLIGTTDTDYAGSLEAPRCERADADYLLRTVNRVFPAAGLTYDDILSTYAGIRPLIGGSDLAASAVSRRHLIHDPGTGMVSIAGGKLTTFRTMAFELLSRCSRTGLLRPLRGREARADFSRRPYKAGLSRAGFEAALDSLRLRGLLPEAALAHLHRQYGHGALGILREVALDPVSGAPLLPGQPFCAAELHHILAYENAPTLMDVMLRRTEMQMLVSHRRQPELAARVAAIMGRWYHWDRPRERDEVERYLAYVRTTIFF